MAAKWIFWPVLVQVLLTLAVYGKLQMAKVRASRRGEVNEGRRALYDDAWPDYVRQINNNIRNQFEVPVLFYVLALALYALDAAGAAAQVAAWLFALSRIAHFYIHTGANVVPVRRPAFTFGVLMLVLMAAMLALALIRA